MATFIDAIEKACGKKAEKIMMPMQKGDVPRTYADIDSLVSATGYAPKVEIYEGIERFVRWFREYTNK